MVVKHDPTQELVLVLLLVYAVTCYAISAIKAISAVNRETPGLVCACATSPGELRPRGYSHWPGNCATTPL